MFIIAENNEENAPKYQRHIFQITGKFLNLQDLRWSVPPRPSRIKIGSFGSALKTLF